MSELEERVTAEFQRQEKRLPAHRLGTWVLETMRLRAGLSKSALARLLGVTRTRVSNIEHDKGRTTLEVVRAWMNATDTCPLEFGAMWQGCTHGIIYDSEDARISKRPEVQEVRLRFSNELEVWRAYGKERAYQGWPAKPLWSGPSLWAFMDWCERRGLCFAIVATRISRTNEYHAEEP